MRDVVTTRATVRAMLNNSMRRSSGHIVLGALPLQGSLRCGFTSCPAVFMSLMLPVGPLVWTLMGRGCFYVWLRRKFIIDKKGEHCQRQRHTEESRVDFTLSHVSRQEGEGRNERGKPGAAAKRAKGLKKSR